MPKNDSFEPLWRLQAPQGDSRHSLKSWRILRVLFVRQKRLRGVTKKALRAGRGPARRAARWNGGIVTSGAKTREAWIFFSEGLEGKICSKV